jgi:hypothetical protein
LSRNILYKRFRNTDAEIRIGRVEECKSKVQCQIERNACDSIYREIREKGEKIELHRNTTRCLQTAGMEMG